MRKALLPLYFQHATVRLNGAAMGIATRSLPST
jgi:hypothetical protein